MIGYRVGSKSRHYFNRPMIFEAIREVDAYLANSAFEADFLSGRGVDPGKITITGVGVDLEPFEQADGAGLLLSKGLNLKLK